MIENGLIEPREDEKKRLAKALGVKVEEIWTDSTIGVHKTRDLGGIF